MNKKSYENKLEKIFPKTDSLKGGGYWYYKHAWECFKEFLGLGIGLLIAIPYIILLLISDIYQKIKIKK